MEILIQNKAGLKKAALEFIKLTGKNKIFAFYGEMGTGKTTIIKSICYALGAADTVTSPTFTIVNEYHTKTGESLYHIDFYRIRKIEEVFDFGIEEYFSSGSYCFLEWPELIGELLPGETVKVKITVGKKGERIMSFE